MLISLILPKLPEVQIYLRNTKEFVSDPQKKQLYDKILSIINTVTQFYISRSLSKLNFKRFKLDYFVTGRGCLWVEYTKFGSSSARRNNSLREEVSIDYVPWLDYAQDPKLKWEDVRWVARRRMLSKGKLKMLYPAISFESVNFSTTPYQYFSEGGLLSSDNYHILS
jgi:hypothetical protein